MLKYLKNKDDYLMNGKEIFDKYCTSAENKPTMLPRAPQHTYIDVYPDEDEPGPSFRDDQKRQLDYEAEVEVYRALEELDLNGNVVVVHSFEFTHHQYRLCDQGHVRKGCKACSKTPNNREGECDFLIIAENCIVIIEVKNMTNFNEVLSAAGVEAGQSGFNEKLHTAGLQGSYRKSVSQRNRMVKLIRSIEKRTNISQFTAYPNFSKKSKAEFHLKPDQLSSIIFKEDKDDFNSWWRNNVSGLFMDEALNSDFREKHEKVRNMLLSIWCTDNKSRCDQSKCSLGWCIQDIDNQLRTGNFIFRKNNPNVLPAPDIIKNYLEVNNLTKEQLDAYNSEEDLVQINGPAGAGKTIILIAKAIQLAKSDENRKILFFVSCSEAQLRVTTALEKANVRHCKLRDNEVDSELSMMGWSTSHISEVISSKLIDNQVIIIQGLDCAKTITSQGKLSRFIIIRRIPEILISHGDCDLFIDDAQVSLLCGGSAAEDRVSLPEKNVIEQITSAISLSRKIWITFDMAQDALRGAHNIDESVGPPIYPPFHPYHSIIFSKNLRNTYDISNTLSVMRNHIEKEILEREIGLGSHVSDETIVKQIPGHYIRGPKITIHFFNERNFNLMDNILHRQLDKLHEKGVLRRFDLAVLIHSLMTQNGAVHVNCTLLSILVWVKMKINQFVQATSAADINLLHSFASASSEWPAVIVLHEYQRNLSLDIPGLFLAMSRARVYCTVLLFPGPYFTFDEVYDYHKIENLLEDLKCYAKIIRH